MTVGVPIIGVAPPTAVVVAEDLAGVRNALTSLLAREPDLEISALAGSVAQALVSPGAVVVAGLRFPDGTAADLCKSGRPVVVLTTVPADERRDVDLSGAVEVVRYGDLRRDLANAIRRAVTPR